MNTSRLLVVFIALYSGLQTIDPTFAISTIAEDCEHHIATVGGTNISIDDVMEAAVCFRFLGNNEKSLQAVDAVIDQAEGFPLALQLRATVLLEMERVKEAEDAIRRSIALDSGTPDDYVILFEILEADDRLREMKVILTNRLDILKEVAESVASDGVRRLSQSEVTLYMLLSEIVYREGNVNNSIEILVEGLSRNNMSVDLFQTLVWLLGFEALEDHKRRLLVEYCHQLGFSSNKYCVAQ